MRALVLGDDGLRLDAAYPDPKPRKNETIVRVTLAGICGTDLQMLRGYKGFRGVPGHEFVGVIEWCGRKPEFVGRRVAGEINVGCGLCGPCRRSGRNHCERREVLGMVKRDGAFAERLSIPGRNVVLLGSTAPDEAMVFVEPLAAARHVLDQVEVTAKTRAVVLGPGRLGRLVAFVLRTQTAEVTVVGRDDPSPGDADVVVDCTGSPEGFVRATEIVRPRGTIVVKSTCADDAKLPASLLTQLVVDEVTVVGSRCGDRDDFEAASHWLATGAIDVAPLVDATYPLADFERAFEHAARPGALKILLDPA
jgi:threonine dehydrogenase-like Zn-dependent dehydrogenase